MPSPRLLNAELNAAAAVKPDAARARSVDGAVVAGDVDGSVVEGIVVVGGVVEGIDGRVFEFFVLLLRDFLSWLLRDLRGVVSPREVDGPSAGARALRLRLLPSGITQQLKDDDQWVGSVVSTKYRRIMLVGKAPSVANLLLQCTQYFCAPRIIPSIM